MEFYGKKLARRTRYKVHDDPENNQASSYSVFLSKQMNLRPHQLSKSSKFMVQIDALEHERSTWHHTTWLPILGSSLYAAAVTISWRCERTMSSTQLVRSIWELREEWKEWKVCLEWREKCLSILWSARDGANIVSTQETHLEPSKMTVNKHWQILILYFIFSRCWWTGARWNWWQQLKDLVSGCSTWRLMASFGSCSESSRFKEFGLFAFFRSAHAQW